MTTVKGGYCYFFTREEKLKNKFSLKNLIFNAKSLINLTTKMI